MTEALATLAFVALDHGIESVREGGPLIPFAIHEGLDGERNLTRFVAEREKEGEARAREFARQNIADGRVAIAWDGYLTVDGDRADAILVEAPWRAERPVRALAV